MVTRHPHDVRRWRAKHLIDAAVEHVNRTAPYRVLNDAIHANVTRGVFDPASGKYDTEAGPRASHGSPRAWQLTVPEVRAIGYAGEVLTITPTWMQNELQFLQRAFPEQWRALRDYARGDARYQVAHYRASRGRVQWHPDCPRALREAAELLAHATETDAGLTPKAPRRE